MFRSRERCTNFQGKVGRNVQEILRHCGRQQEIVIKFKAVREEDNVVAKRERAVSKRT